ncbi:LuxR C-terminal-related transcriptional regulator [Kitasatospora sp. NPDC004240]
MATDEDERPGRAVAVAARPAPVAPGAIPPPAAAPVLTEAERALYLAALDNGGSLPAERITPADAEALAGLLALGLFVPCLMESGHLAVSPRVAAAQLGAELRSEATRLLVRAERLPDALAELTRAYDALPRMPERPGGAAYVTGRDAVRHRIAQILSDCRQELLTVQPGLRPTTSLQLALRQDLPLLRRGRSVRTLYQPLVLTQPGVIAYATEVTRHGSRIRILDEPFQRMLVVDREIAVITAAGDHDAAAFVTDPAAVAFLVGVFERDWARADTVDWSAAARDEDTEESDRVARLLARGLTQRAVATRLGLSERTVAGRISRLRVRYGARTLFELGWRMRGGRDA